MYRRAKCYGRADDDFNTVVSYNVDKEMRDAVSDLREGMAASADRITASPFEGSTATEMNASVDRCTAALTATYMKPGAANRQPHVIPSLMKTVLGLKSLRNVFEELICVQPQVSEYDASFWTATVEMEAMGATVDRRTTLQVVAAVTALLQALSNVRADDVLESRNVPEDLKGPVPRRRIQNPAEKADPEYEQLFYFQRANMYRKNKCYGCAEEDYALVAKMAGADKEMKSAVADLQLAMHASADRLMTAAEAQQARSLNFSDDADEEIVRSAPNAADAPDCLGREASIVACNTNVYTPPDELTHQQNVSRSVASCATGLSATHLKPGRASRQPHVIPCLMKTVMGLTTMRAVFEELICAHPNAVTPEEMAFWTSAAEMERKDPASVSPAAAAMIAATTLNFLHNLCDSLAADALEDFEVPSELSGEVPRRVLVPSKGAVDPAYPALLAFQRGNMYRHARCYTRAGQEYAQTVSLCGAQPQRKALAEACASITAVTKYATDGLPTAPCPADAEVAGALQRSTAVLSAAYMQGGDSTASIAAMSALLKTALAMDSLKATFEELVCAQPTVADADAAFWTAAVEMEARNNSSCSSSGGIAAGKAALIEALTDASVAAILNREETDFDAWLKNAAPVRRILASNAAADSSTSYQKLFVFQRGNMYRRARCYTSATANYQALVALKECDDDLRTVATDLCAVMAATAGTAVTASSPAVDEEALIAAMPRAAERSAEALESVYLQPGAATREPHVVPALMATLMQLKTVKAFFEDYVCAAFVPAEDVALWATAVEVEQLRNAPSSVSPAVASAIAENLAPILSTLCGVRAADTLETMGVGEAAEVERLTAPRYDPATSASNALFLFRRADMYRKAKCYALAEENLYAVLGAQPDESLRSAVNDIHEAILFINAPRLAEHPIITAAEDDGGSAYVAAGITATMHQVAAVVTAALADPSATREEAEAVPALLMGLSAPRSLKALFEETVCRYVDVDEAAIVVWAPLAELDGPADADAVYPARDQYLAAATGALLEGAKASAGAACAAVVAQPSLAAVRAAGEKDAKAAQLAMRGIMESMTFAQVGKWRADGADAITFADAVDGDLISANDHCHEVPAAVLTHALRSLKPTLVTPVSFTTEFRANTLATVVAAPLIFLSEIVDSPAAFARDTIVLRAPYVYVDVSLDNSAWAGRSLAIEADVVVFGATGTSKKGIHINLGGSPTSPAPVSGSLFVKATKALRHVERVKSVNVHGSAANGTVTALENGASDVSAHFAVVTTPTVAPGADAAPRDATAAEREAAPARPVGVADLSWFAKTSSDDGATTLQSIGGAPFWERAIPCLAEGGEAEAPLPLATPLWVPSCLSAGEPISDNANAVNGAALSALCKAEAYRNKGAFSAALAAVQWADAHNTKDAAVEGALAAYRNALAVLALSSPAAAEPIAADEAAIKGIVEPSCNAVCNKKADAPRRAILTATVLLQLVAASPNAALRDVFEGVLCQDVSMPSDAVAYLVQLVEAEASNRLADATGCIEMTRAALNAAIETATASIEAAARGEADLVESALTAAYPPAVTARAMPAINPLAPPGAEGHSSTSYPLSPDVRDNTFAPADYAHTPLAATANGPAAPGYPAAPAGAYPPAPTEGAPAAPGYPAAPAGAYPPPPAAAYPAPAEGQGPAGYPGAQHGNASPSGVPLNSGYPAPIHGHRGLHDI